MRLHIAPKGRDVSMSQQELGAGCRCAMANSIVMSLQTAYIPERIG